MFGEENGMFSWDIGWKKDKEKEDNVELGIKMRKGDGLNGEERCVVIWIEIEEERVEFKRWKGNLEMVGW